MKKNIVNFAVICLILSFAMIGCGGKYADAQKINKEYISIMQDYINDIDAAQNAGDAAAAMNKFADGMENLWPKMQKLSEKYPELKNHENPPEELVETQKQAEEIAGKMAGTMMKLMPYMKDPEVRNAQKRLGSIMKKQR